MLGAGGELKGWEKLARCQSNPWLHEEAKTGVKIRSRQDNALFYQIDQIENQLAKKIFFFDCQQGSLRLYK